MAEVEDPVLRPASSSSSYFDFTRDYLTNCLFCDVQYLLPKEREDFLAHLFHQHKLVIGNVNDIAHFKGYIDYWRIRFQSSPVTKFCTIFSIQPGVDSDGDIETHFFLSDAIPEDKLLREGLHMKRLDWILKEQESERNRDVSRHCLLCQLDFTGPRIDYFNHLSSKHNLKLGSPNNLVFTDEFLNIIDDKLKRQECLFCGRIFKTLSVLKEHMRKKQHKRINPEDKSLDKFFVVNYLEMGKNWEQIQGESDDSESASEATGWSDWEDEAQELPTVCLYCDYYSTKYDAILEHMKSVHDFDYNETIRTQKLIFYDQVKLINYIRKRMNDFLCISCIEKFQSREKLLEHMSSANHFQVPDKELWDHPMYYVPNYECDSFLCQLHDIEDSEEEIQ